MKEAMTRIFELYVLYQDKNLHSVLLLTNSKDDNVGKAFTSYKHKWNMPKAANYSTFSKLSQLQQLNLD
jgi:hypothetical protein